MQSREIIEKFIFTNPLNYKYFTDVSIRLAFIIVIGLIIVILFNLKDLKNIHRSSAFQKLIGWIIIAPTFLLSVMCGGILALLLISYIVIRCLKEFISIFNLPRYYFFALIGIWFSSVFIVITLYILRPDSFYYQFIYTLPILYLLSLSLISILRGRLEEIMKRVTYSYFASMWICYTMIHFILLSKKNMGMELLLMIGFSVALSDVFAFIIGKLFDKINFGTRYKIAENISPNKTYAGVVGNFFGSAIGIILLNFLLPDFKIWHFVILIFIIGIASSLGDMLESLVKRAAGIKDASKAIFGHGGFLDRVDSMLIVIILVYYYLLFFTDFIK